jgi:glycogen operon protein
MDIATMTDLFLEPGATHPLGANSTGRGTNFVVYSKHAERVELCLFDAAGEREVARIDLPMRTGDLWHGFLPAEFGVPGLLYGYRVHGPYRPAEGHRFNPAKLLLDPCALEIHGELDWQGSLACADPTNDAMPSGADSAAFVPKSRVVDGTFDWGDSRSPNVPWRDTIIYEAHVKGLTQLHPDVPAEHRGKYLGLAHPAVLDYLRGLGITSVELMPVQAFLSEKFLVDRGLVNYWGYNPIAWYAPQASYALANPVREFKTMVRALHNAGLEVILDVVFNHTAEGNQHGPMLSLRGFDNSAYYRLDPHQLAHYENITGCGNTLRFDHPAVRALVLDCLRYWVIEMRVDGFRFDLAPVLGRDPGGYSQSAPFFAALRSDPVLSCVKLIAEPWDVGFAGYQLGHFPAGWSEWNDRYRDTVRAFWRGDRPLVGSFAERISGSSDLFRQGGRKPTASVNFVAAHDGFTLHDTVSYDHKHNEGNLESNGDGHNHNLSWNCGEEGPSEDPQVLELRRRQMRNLLATVFISHGVPMLLAGDEFGRTQYGNNNAYCQDTPISWVDWSLTTSNRELLEFSRQLIDLRRSRLWLRRDTFLKGSSRAAGARDVMWLHPTGREMTESDWNDASLRAIAVLMSHGGAAEHADELLAVFNADDHPLAMSLPPASAGAEWRLLFDTARGSLQPGVERIAADERLQVSPRSVILLESRERPRRALD